MLFLELILHLITPIMLIPYVQAEPAASIARQIPNTNQTQSIYPSQQQIYSIFSELVGPTGNLTAFFQHVRNDVNWTIEGTHPLAGQYNNKTILESSFLRINEVGSSETPLEVSIVNIVGGGSEEWSVQELEVKGVCKSGLLFDNRYAWVTRWDTQGLIEEARAYLDSSLVAAALFQNELGQFTYTDPRQIVVAWTDLTSEEVVGATGLNNSLRT